MLILVIQLLETKEGDNKTENEGVGREREEPGAKERLKTIEGDGHCRHTVIGPFRPGLHWPVLPYILAQAPSFKAMRVGTLVESSQHFPTAGEGTKVQWNLKWVALAGKGRGPGCIG